MTTLKVGIASYEEMKARTMAVARGEWRVGSNEPKAATRYRRKGAWLARRTGADNRQGQTQSVTNIEENGGLRSCPP